MNILVLGGTGFVGRHLIARLASQGYRVTVPTRRIARGRELLVHPTVTVLAADVHHDATLERLVAGQDAVVNLVGMLHGGRGKPYGAGFRQAHVQLPARLALACRTQRVRRLLHVSSLDAAVDAPSMYLRSKAAGETALRSELTGWAEATPIILRPSVIFGPGDAFMTRLARLARWLPVLPVASAQAKLQPIYVGDVVTAITTALARPALTGAYDLAGPQAYTLAELAALAAHVSGHPRPVLALPAWLARMQALVLERLPGQLLTRDNLDTLKATSASIPERTLCPVPTPLEAVVPGYLR